MTSAEAPVVSVVRDRLKHYQEQGVLGGLSENAGRRSSITFRFHWLLGHDFFLEVDPTRMRIRAKNLLPAVEYRSFMDTDLRRFIAGRSDESLPRHRRLDPDLAVLSYRNRKQDVSLLMQVEAEQTEYGVKALLSTINDLFAYLQLYHIDYLHRQFGLPEE